MLTERVIFLPVVERELRVAARKRSTFWVRIAAALVTLVLGSGCLILVDTIGGGFTTPAIGKFLFGALTWLSLALALFAGVFFTSDCLSEEKREGTLGFLFLTDLRGYDVVLGKLLATSLRGFYTFFAVLPVLAITLLMGGVTGGEFWRVCVALVSALFFSLSAGMFVSTLSRNPQKAMGCTLFLLVVACALGPALDALARAIGPVAALSSPVYLFLSAGWSGQSDFGKALLLNQIVAWIFLALSCVLLPHTWQVKANRTSAATENWARRWKFGSEGRRERLRAKFLPANPVLWLASRERWQATALWVASLLLGGALALMIGTGQQGSWILWSYLAGALSLVLYLAAAADSGRFFVNAQRSGLTELLLATPLTVRDIVFGHWRALVRTFALPVIACLAIQFVGTTIAQQQTYAQFAAAAAAAPPITVSNMSNGVVVSTSINVVGGTPTIIPAGISKSLMQRLIPFLDGALTALTMLANLAALCWFGMWMGMTSKSSNLATLKTFLFVQVIPWFIVMFGSSLLVMLVMMPSLMKNTGGSGWMLWYPLASAVVTTTLSIAKDAGFIIWSRRRLLSDFRLRATGSVLSLQTLIPPRFPAQPGPGPS